jgi:hypothetical protein
MWGQDGWVVRGVRVEILRRTPSVVCISRSTGVSNMGSMNGMHGSRSEGAVLAIIG